jgi:hypothetical protein
MTWVIGACPLLGAYAITVSDIQVTFPDGRTFDLVRKAYPVGPNLIGGFAGVMTSDRTINLDTPEEQEIRMPRVARSFLELLKMAKELDIDGATAIA